ncbi:alpha/beta fold hydrolase [Acinetobacter silvestris]|uniref:Alpha/beta hydrolase n=1 Tax=Acinetobacter silvestris TaxID=1977882 RepID=A0A1Y3CEK0_9GAMM|nr:alpha/beta hydrolase [Acinetobacter silvestris]OTG65529.1 alpha/beta hydrolase [Acinetobacter silvestris]
MLHLLTQKVLQTLTTSMLVLAASTTLLWSTPSSALTETAEYIDYQKILQEERAWAGLSTKKIRIGDVIWSYSEGGSKTKPTILLIHGLASSRDTWNEVAHQLTPYYHVIIPDLPSSGSTVVPTNFDLSVPNVTEQLRRFVEAAHIQDKLNIAGHSLGGSIAMFYAAQYPFDTQSLFLISSGGLFQNNNTNYLKNPIYLKQLLVSQPGDLDFVLKKVMYSPPFTSSVIKREQEKILISHASETVKIINQINELNKLYTPSSFAKMVKEIEAPTLILWEKQDQIVNIEVVQDLKGLLKRPETPIILNNVGHMPILEAPERVSMSYLSFLEKTQHQNHSLSEHYMNK